MMYKEVKSEAELELLAQLIQEIWPEVFVPIIGKEQVDYMLVHYQGKDVIVDEIKRGAKYFIIEHKEQPVGYFAYWLEEDRLFISKLYLKKEFRNLGLGTKAFLHFQEVARKNGKPKLFLKVNRYNEQAVEVYLRRGFEIVKTIDQPLGDKFLLTDYWMEKA